ncbi:MAG: rhomboid family intramembrane serine protease [Pseudomonadota bacterium]
MTIDIGPVSAVILLVNVALSLTGLMGMPSLIQRCLFRPYFFLRARQYLTPVSSAFVHADYPHLIFNMITFWMFGIGLERVLGSARFACLYVAGLVLSQLGTWYKHRNNPDYATLGASGAISAVLFASIVYMPTQTLIIIPFPFPIPAPLFAIGYLAYSWWSARQNKGRINHDAHFGGAVAGLAFVALVDPQAYSRALEQLGY